MLLRKKANVEEIRDLISGDVKRIEKEIVNLGNEVESVYQEMEKKLSEIPNLKEFNMLNKLIQQKADISDLAKIRDLEREVNSTVQELQN